MEKEEKNYENYIWAIIAFVMIFIMFDIYKHSNDVNLPITSIKTEKIKDNIYEIKQINDINLTYYFEYYVNDKVDTSCSFIGNKGYVIPEHLSNKNFKIICNGKDVERVILPKQKLTVEEALKKHNLELTADDRLDTMFIHFFGYNLGKMLALLGFMGTFVVYMMTHKGSVLFGGIIISLITGAIIGISSMFYDYDPADKFYKKIEKRTGEKIIRNFDFF